MSDAPSRPADAASRPRPSGSDEHRTNGATKSAGDDHAEPIRVQDRRAAARQAGETGGTDDQPAHQTVSPEQPPYVVQLEAQLAEKDARLTATLAQYKEALDEFGRVKVRLQRDIGKEIEAGKRNLLGDLLEVMDNLERALQAQEGQANGQPSSLYAGVVMVRDQFRQKLEAMGVRKLEALGKPFDPAHFEAISNVPVDKPEQDGLVMGVVRDGYLLGEQTLRHGIVAVGKHQAG